MSSYDDTNHLETADQDYPMRGTSFYYLQVTPDGNISRPVEGVPVHLFVNDEEHNDQQYHVPGLLPKLNSELSLCIESFNQNRTGILGNGEIFTYQTITQDVNNVNPTYIQQDSNIICQIETKHINADSNETKNRREGSSKIVENSSNVNEIKPYISQYVHIADRVVPPRALLVLPPALQARRDCIFPRRSLPERVRFGPVKGIKHKLTLDEVEELISVSSASNVPVFFARKADDSVIHIDVCDKDKANWLSLLPLGDQKTANVWLYEEDGKIYGITTKSIPSRTPLTLGYSKQYAEKHRLPPGQPVLDLAEVNGSEPWWCFECRRSMGSLTLLQKHMVVYHKEVKSAKRRHRCNYCTRTFSKLFTLRRHMQKFCTTKNEILEKQQNLASTEGTHIIPFTPSAEDKAPSDESFNNFTNSLDFSSNLFDTDRLNLDMSGGSRSDNEFNNFSVGCKDCGLAHDMGFSNEAVISHKDCDINKKEDMKIKSKNEEIQLTSCIHCRQTIPKLKVRQHIKECPSRRFMCQCGLVFNKKETLAKHIHTEHADSLKKTINDETKKHSDENNFHCDRCPNIFKRRGMLVNHLWRIHQASPKAVPLVRRVRHYPCALCPKVYRAASKRNIHMRKHHPGDAQIRVAPIEGEQRTYEPSSCTACPRQYATRAKLLQHMRANHPDLAAAQKPHSSQKSVKLKTETIKETSPYQNLLDSVI